MTLLLGTVAFAVLSALLPLFNMEAYLVVAATDERWPALALGSAAAVGQMVGKLAWFYAGTQSVRLPWIRKKLQEPKWQASYDRWHARTDGRPVLTGFLLWLSAFAGLPPFAVMAVLAGALRVNLALFLVTGVVGRALRFWVVLEAASYAWLLL